MLCGLLRDRLVRRNAEDKEKRRFLFSSLGLSVSVENCVSDISGVIVMAVEVLDLAVNISGSSETSREEGAESVRE